MSSKKNSENNGGILSGSGSQQVGSMIGGVLSIAASGVLILSAFGAAGVAGSGIYSGLHTAIGIGYWILVVGLLALAVHLLGNRQNLPSPTIAHGISGLLLFVSVLGLVAMTTSASGGLIGRWTAGGVESVFSIYAGAILLEVIAVISAIALLDELIDLHRSVELPATISLPAWIAPQALQTSTDGSAEENGLSISDTTETNTETPSDEQTENDQASDTPDRQPDTDEPEQSDSSGEDYEVADYETLQQADATAKPDTSDGGYTPPPVTLLSDDVGSPEVGDVKARANKIKRTLENFNINVEMDEVSIGPTVTRYALKPAEGVRLNKITNLQSNLEMALAAHPVRLEAPIPGKSLVGVEVPNEEKTTVGLASLIGTEKFQESSSPLLLGLGQGISGESYFTDLNEMPHLLIGGATGSGKSVTAHALINSLLFRKSPEQLKLIMVDPKRVELTLYDGIPHLLTPVITSAKKAILALKWAAQEMDRRYDILEETGARDIRSYHDKLDELRAEAGPDDPEPDAMPYIVVVIDEMADLMQAYPKELESVIVRIAQMSRAVGIHLVLSTQRPDVNVITGLIKANVPARLALQVSSQVDSRTILDTNGAEQLLGEGDMLFQSGDMSKPVRIQSAFISEDEVKAVSNHLKDQYEGELQDSVSLTKDEEESKTIFDVAREEEEKEERDEKYEEALETVVEADKASTSYLQRKLRIGYSRAARIMDELEDNGIITEKDGTKARDVLITKEQLEAAREGRLEQSQAEEDNDEEPADSDSEKVGTDEPEAEQSAETKTDKQ